MPRKKDNLASKLQGLAQALVETGLEVGLTVGRKPNSANRSRIHQILEDSSPLCATIQAKMLCGELQRDPMLFDMCDRVLDRVDGKPRQKHEVAGFEGQPLKVEYELVTRDKPEAVQYGDESAPINETTNFP